MNMLSPANGQIALARRFADGEARVSPGNTHVPAFGKPLLIMRDKTGAAHVFSRPAQ